jgi:hypothetical protein
VSKTNVTYVAIIVNDAFNFAMIKNQRSYVSKNSNSLNGMIKKTSMTFTTTVWKRISTIFIAVILLSSTVVFNFGYFEAEAKKPGSSTEGPISWSNGFPSGPHSNVNVIMMEKDQGLTLEIPSLFRLIHKLQEMQIKTPQT